MLESENLLQILFRYFFARGSACRTSQVFSSGFDLSTDLTAAKSGLRIIGGYPNNIGEQAGSSVHSAGDVNGDGFDDLIIGAPANREFYAPGTNEGVAYVVFGGNSPVNVDLSSGLSSSGKGFKIIYGLNTSNMLFGSVVRSAGDVNDDGYDDIIIGAPYNLGKAFVVFGKSSFPGDIDVNTMPSTDGFTIRSTGLDTGLGPIHTVDGIGDFNGDGIDDIALATPNIYLDPAGGWGTAVVVYGKPSGSPFSTIDINTFVSGSEGIEIPGPSGSYEGGKVAAAGDVNGDGLQDVIIGTPRSPYSPSLTYPGRVFVIFGQSGTPGSPVLTASIVGGDATRGFMIYPPNISDYYFGESVAPVGDINGDGYDDIIAAFGINFDRAVVIYGSPAPVNIALNTMSADQGFVITHTNPSDPAEMGIGESVYGNFDINADGISDLMFGLPAIDSGSFTETGEAKIVFGDSAGMGNIELYNLPSTDGFSLKFSNPTAGSYYMGKSVSSAGDVNGDGCDDIIVGAIGVRRDGYVNSGAAYVIFGGK